MWRRGGGAPEGRGGEPGLGWCQEEGQKAPSQRAGVLALPLHPGLEPRGTFRTLRQRGQCQALASSREAQAEHFGWFLESALRRPSLDASSSSWLNICPKRPTSRLCPAQVPRPCQGP